MRKGLNQGYTFPTPHKIGIGVSCSLLAVGILLGSVTIVLSGTVLLATTVTALVELWRR